MAGNNDYVPGFDDVQEDSLKFILRPIPNVDKGMLIVLTGYIDTYNSNYFQNQVTKIIQKDFYNLIFECTNLTGLASTGFGILTSLLKKVHIMGGDIVLSNLQPQITETIQLLGFAHFFKIVESMEDAMKQFGASLGPATTAAAPNTSFPMLLSCPSCNRQLKAQHGGRFRCINCKAVIVITDDGRISVE